MTDFRAKGTIMGLAGLTAVFGMGTGVAPPVWSPGIRPAGGQARRPRWSSRWSVTQASHVASAVAVAIVSATRPSTDRGSSRMAIREARRAIAGRPSVRGGGGSGWSSRSAVRTGRLRRSPAVHSRPIDLVVFQEPSQLTLLETSSWRGLRA